MIAKVCEDCAEPLYYVEESGVFACPWAPSGLIGRVDRQDQDIRTKHTTGIPAELWDEDFEPTEAMLRKRHRRADVLSDLPATGPASREQLRTYGCSDCGYRTPSSRAMAEHLDRMRHDYGEAPTGERVHGYTHAGVRR